ncbi:MAG: hypothetical protein BroJett014_11310 [Planctomycetota bacterium]|nr:hypothetical protein [Planctomycetota bacterium]GIK52158.1 MAG: hypothetical protein BroJett014_11310 [Planctomycetota bacterium]
MARFHAGPQIEIRLSKSFGRSLFALMLLAAKSELVKISQKDAAAPKCVLSRGQAEHLLSWLKRFEHQYSAGDPTSFVVDPLFLEAIDGLATVVGQWDETVDSLNKIDDELKESPLARYNAMVSNPYVGRLRDRKTWEDLFELAFSRAVWASAFRRLHEFVPGEAWRIAPHAAALHAAELQRPLGKGVAANGLERWMRERHEAVIATLKKLIEDFTKEAAAKADAITHPSHALALAGEVARSALGGGLPEAYVARQADVAAQNVCTQLGKAVRKDAISVEEYAPLLDGGDPVGAWVLEPITSKLGDEVAFEVYFPIALRPTEAFECAALGIKLVDSIPDWVEERVRGWRGNFTLFLRVEVHALTAELARRAADRRAALLFDALFDLDGLKPFMRKYDAEYAIAVNPAAKSARTWGPHLPGLPETRASLVSVQQNISTLLDMAKDTQPAWCRQAARTLHLLRIAGEANDVETRFVHSWRALESVVGHLTGMNAEPFHVELLAQARCYVSQDFVKEGDATKRRGYFQRELNDVKQNLDPVQDIRNKWALHTGDERTGTLHDVDPETLADACDWLADEIVQLFYVLMDVAVKKPGIPTRKDVHAFLEQTLFPAPPELAG